MPNRNNVWFKVMKIKLQLIMKNSFPTTIMMYLESIRVKWVDFGHIFTSNTLQIQNKKFGRHNIYYSEKMFKICYDTFQCAVGRVFYSMRFCYPLYPSIGVKWVLTKDAISSKMSQGALVNFIELQLKIIGILRNIML